MQKHRRAQIIDALEALFEPLRSDSADPYGVSEFPMQVRTVQKRYRHWTALDQQGAIPAMLLSYDEVIRGREGGENTKYASLNETEEPLPIALDVVLKEVEANSIGTPKYAAFPEPLKTFLQKPLTDQVSDALYTVERLIKGTPDLDVEGVHKTEIAEAHTSAGRIAALEGEPFEVIRFRIIVTHIYPSNTSV